MTPDSPHTNHGPPGSPAGSHGGDPAGNAAGNPGASEPEHQAIYLSHLLQIQYRLRQAETPKELACILVNDTLQLVPYRQAIFWESTGNGKICIKAISGTDQVEINGPYPLFLKNIISSLGQKPDKGPLIAKKVKENIAAEWETWLPQKNLLVCPLNTTKGTILGGLILLRTDPWHPWEEAMLEQVTHAFVHEIGRASCRERV